MPKKKNYPQWFSPDHKPTLPHKPVEPPKEITNYIKIKSFDVSGYIKASELMETKADSFAVKYTHCSYGIEDLKLTAYKEETGQNAGYSTLLGYYKANLTRYHEEYKKVKAQIKEWRTLKAKWDAEETEERKAYDLKQLAVLKAKYEK